jgi:sterol desaturase/sphingolipid hydroxylase (fatty acid hydroxylase superfamily)
MEKLVSSLLYEYAYISLFLLSLCYFLILYFGLGSLFLAGCKFLAKKGILEKIEHQKLKKNQIRFEIKKSISSIFIFGLSILPIIFLIRINFIQLLPNTGWNILVGLAILTIWNEVHFYIVHRILHFKWFMKNIHYIHHRSTVPTVYSVYSFHWFEALLLSTVPLLIVPFIPFSIIAIFTYPIISILLNFAGHCNYRFGKGKKESWLLFGTYHNEHHSAKRKNFGFALNLLDKIFTKHKTK